MEIMHHNIAIAFKESLNKNLKLSGITAWGLLDVHKGIFFSGQKFHFVEYIVICLI